LTPLFPAGPIYRDEEPFKAQVIIAKNRAKQTRNMPSACWKQTKFMRKIEDYAIQEISKRRVRELLASEKGKAPLKGPLVRRNAATMLKW
jgi:hypothetical protein